MVTRAVLKYVRITPRKFRQIIPLVKGKDPEEAMAILMSVKKNASRYAIDLLKSAIASVKRMQGVDASNLYISKLIADCGPSLKRFRAASMGRASKIIKRTSHLTLELDQLAQKGGHEAPAHKAAHAGLVKKGRKRVSPSPKKEKAKKT